MTARSAAIASLVLCGSLACTNFYEIPIETPIQPKMDVSAFQRVLVAGFIGGGTEDVDANLETVRLLRSQLRSKSALRVIEAEALPLVQLAIKQGQPGSAQEGATDGQIQPVSQPPSKDSDQEQRIRNEKDLERYQGIFADVEFWKRIGEEHQNPLIVTGTVLFTPHQQNGFVIENREFYDQFGRRRVTPVRTYMERKGFILTPKFIFIDGRTGATLYSEQFREEVLYSAQQNTPALSSYFELMDKLIPSFLNALSTQKVRGTRVLLK
ncbi:MAG TPA: hypothetical protein VHJ58_00465 [Vicinamibacterales bacterium]|jgi:hypothetical protein|nr:hypothetical protein [Vicinamibacterales bacterium]